MGGAIFVDPTYTSSETTLTIDSCTLNGNTAARDGGAIYSTTYSSSGTPATAVTISDSMFTNNTASVSATGDCSDRE